jgi:hypothetical protein
MASRTSRSSSSILSMTPSTLGQSKPTDDAFSCVR